MGKWLPKSKMRPTMKQQLNRLLVGSALGMVTLVATPAFAAGTNAGDTITNTVTVNYQVGGVAQTAIQASDNLIVDRKINFTVAEVGTATTSVVPGQTNAVTTFTVTNTSNTAIDIGLAAAQLGGGTPAHGGTDNFDITGMTMYVDNPTTGTVGSWDAGDAVITYIDELAADAAKTIFIVGAVPIGATNGQIAGVTLTGTAQEAGVASTQGSNWAATTGANTAGIDTVLADAAGLSGDVAYDGKHSDDDDYTVSAPLLNVYKTSRVISDPVNGTTDPKMIPGAVVEYCLIVVNGAGGSAATSVSISDPLPSETTYFAGFTPLVGGSYTGTAPTGTCNADGTATAGAFSAGTISGSLGTLNASTTKTIVFRVTIN